MKKIYLFIFTILSIMFINISNVSAYTFDNSKIVTYDLNNEMFTNNYNLLKDKLEEVHQIIKDNNTYNHNYVIHFGYRNGFEYINVNLTDFNIERECSLSTYYGPTSTPRVLLLSVCNFVNSDNILSSNISYNRNFSNSNTNRSDYESFKTYLTNYVKRNTNSTVGISGVSQGAGFFIDTYGHSISFNNNNLNLFDYDDIKNNFAYIYASTYRITNTSIPNRNYTYYPLKINDTIYYENDVIPALLELNSNNNKIYNATVSSSSNKAVKIQYDKSLFPANDIGTDVDIKFDIKNISSGLPIPIPYLSKTYADLGGGFFTKTDKSLMFNETQNSYSKNLTYHVEGIINSFYFYIPLPTGFLDIDIYYESSLPFEVEIIPRESESTIKTLDITNYYGVIMIPKVKSGTSNSDVIGYFRQLDGTTRLKIYNDINDISNNKDPILNKYITRLEIFNYQFTKDNYNQLLYFTNNEYESGGTNRFEYDTEYFNYCLVENEETDCKITNPNTDEEVVIPTYPSTSNTDFSIGSLTNKFKQFIKPIQFLFQGVTNLYTNYLNSTVQNFFFIIFGFTVLTVIFKFIL